MITMTMLGAAIFLGIPALFFLGIPALIFFGAPLLIGGLLAGGGGLLTIVVGIPAFIQIIFELLSKLFGG